MNQKGLFVGQNSAASVPRDERLTLFAKRFKSAEGWFGGEWLVRNCSSVSQALEQHRIFTGYPMIYVLADKNETAVVECLPNGRFVVRRTDAGAITHTNHFIFTDATQSNRTVPASSSARLVQINKLLATQPKPFALGQFLSFATNADEGPDLSLFRTGSKPRSPKTTCIWLMSFPQKGGTISHLRLLNDTIWETTREEFPASTPAHPVKPLTPIPIVSSQKSAESETKTPESVASDEVPTP